MSGLMRIHKWLSTRIFYWKRYGFGGLIASMPTHEWLGNKWYNFRSNLHYRWVKLRNRRCEKPPGYWETTCNYEVCDHWDFTLRGEE